MKLGRSRKPIQFAALTLPHKQLLDYPDCGSWKCNADGSPAFVGAADTGDDVSNMAILLHEIIESFLCWAHGVSEESVSKFDRMWFKEQEEGKHEKDDEPGYDPRSPYREWHLVAEKFEREFCTQAGLMWDHHVENVNKLYA